MQILLKFLNMKKLFTIISAILVVVSCGATQQEYDSLMAKNSQLEAEVLNLKQVVESLKQVVENYENTPDRLYSGVAELIANKDIEGLTALCAKFEKYHPASIECQKAKSALQMLIDEKDAREKAEKAKRMQAVNKLKKEYDDVSGCTWYYNPYFTHYNNENLTSLYIGQKGTNIWLRLKMSYEGDDWIFFENAYLSYDGNTRTIPFNEYDDKKSDIGYGRVWEWIDVAVADTLLSYLKDMVNGKTLKMRLSGKYTETRTLTENERKALQDVLLAYDVLKNGK